MYRKQADRLIVRDLKRRLASMEHPDWRQAAIASWAANPDWFRHHEGQWLDGIGAVLKAAGVELVTAASQHQWVGNEAGADDKS